MGFSDTDPAPKNGKSASAGQSASGRAAANRRNAARSTGPRTEAGKAKSSMNAVKHGLTAQTAVLPGEDAEELEALARDLHAQLRPVGAVQRILAERVVSLAWKLRRCGRAEATLGDYLMMEPSMDWKAEQQEQERYKKMKGVPRVLLEELPLPPDLRTGAESLADEFLGISKDKPLQRLTEYELKLETALRRTIHELRQLRKDENFAAAPGEEEQPPAKDDDEAAAPPAPPPPVKERATAAAATPAAPDPTPIGAEISGEQNEPIPDAPADAKGEAPPPPA